jgi:hypothetical protein
VRSRYGMVTRFTNNILGTLGLIPFSSLNVKSIIFTKFRNIVASSIFHHEIDHLESSPWQISPYSNQKYLVPKLDQIGELKIPLVSLLLVFVIRQGIFPASNDEGQTFHPRPWSTRSLAGKLEVDLLRTE